MTMIEQVLPDIQRAARTVASRWPSVADADDMTQALTLYFLERKGSLEKLTELEEGDRIGRLVRIGGQLAGEWRSAKELFSGNVTYSVEDVKNLLERRALDGQVDRFDAQVADVLAAFEELSKKNLRYATALVDRYFNDVEIPRVAHAERKLLDRAVSALTDWMNRINRTERYEHNNGGRFRNTRAAINAADEDYDGEGRFDG